MSKKAVLEPSAPVQGEAIATPLLAGLDWGTNTSCLHAASAEEPLSTASHLVPTVVGYAREGLLEGILPGDSEVLFGETAVRHRLHLRLVRPLEQGVIADRRAAEAFAQELRRRLDAPAETEIRAVIGVPANATPEAREAVRNAVEGVFQKIILIPEPFLAALGYRDESKLGQGSYLDPVSNSLFVDIGAGSSDLCLVQGYYPRAEDQVSLPFAGDAIDRAFADAVVEKYPDCDLSLEKVRAIKEEFAYVGELQKPIIVERLIRGKLRKLDLGEELGAACSELLKLVFDAVKVQIARAESDTVAELLGNIILTGGGSLIKNFDRELEHMLAAEGYDQPRVRSLGPDYKQFVARGAMKAARAARERQWQTLIGQAR